MKCIKCHVDNNLRDRKANKGRCNRCNHPFAFEPTTMDVPFRFTDGFFAKALADVSAKNTLYFTRRELLYLLEMRLARKARVDPFGCVFFLLLIPIYIISGLIGHIWPFFVYIFLGTIGWRCAHKWLQRRPLPIKKITKGLFISDAMLDNWLKKWELCNGLPARLLPPPSAPASLTPAVAADDVTSYSFDRVLVCENDEIAQLLIANNIHFEHNCAVLSISGYPQAIFSTTMAMLRRNPDLQVFALHNCSPSGVALSHKLRTSPDWSLNSNQVIIDLGIMPRQIAGERDQAYIQVSEAAAKATLFLPPKVKQSLTEIEIKWLESGYFIDLESLTPKKLIHIVSQGIASAQMVGGDVDKNFILFVALDGPDRTFVYASDNFG